MIRFLCIVLSLCVASSAAALSCMRPDVARSFQQMEQAKDVYVIVDGRLEFDSALLPEGDHSGQTVTPRRTNIPATLSGRSLGWNGFDHRFEKEVKLVAQCHGPWCTTIKSGERYLAFVKRTAEGYELWSSPCSDRVFSHPTDAQRDIALQCLRGNRCIPG